MYLVSDDILDRVSERLYGVRQYNGYIAACCPFHEDENPSLLVNHKFWNCLACGAKGRTEYLLKVLGDYVAPPFGTKKRKSLNRLTLLVDEFGLEGLVNVLSSPSYYLISRGIDQKHQERVGVGVIEGMVVFPIRDHFGELIGVMARYVTEGVKPKYVAPRDQKPLLFCPDWTSVMLSSKVFVVWGMIDALTLFVLGFPVVTPTAGIGSSPSLFTWLRKRLILIPDRGEEKQVSRICSSLDWRGKIAVPPYPDGAKDVNDFYRSYPKDLLSFLEGIYYE